MFSKFGNGFLSGLNAFFTKEKMLILCIFLVLMWALVRYSTDKGTVVDKMTTGDAPESDAPVDDARPAPARPHARLGLLPVRAPPGRLRCQSLPTGNPLHVPRIAQGPYLHHDHRPEGEN